MKTPNYMRTEMSGRPIQGIVVRKTMELVVKMDEWGNSTETYGPGGAIANLPLEDGKRKKSRGASNISHSFILFF